LVAHKGGFEPLEISVEPTYTKKKNETKDAANADNNFLDIKY